MLRLAISISAEVFVVPGILTSFWSAHLKVKKMCWENLYNTTSFMMRVF
jgi:hypothetical protein